MDDVYPLLLISFQIVFLLVSLVFVAAFTFSARDAGRTRRAGDVSLRAARFLSAVQSISVAIALLFFFWGFNVGSGLVLAVVPLPPGWRIAHLVFMMAFWLACAFRLAWAWDKLQRAIRQPPDS